MNNTIYHRALGALYIGMKRINGGEAGVDFSFCEQVFQEMLIELENRNLEIVEKKND